MSEQPQAPILIKEIPAQIVNEGGTFGPIDLSQFIESPNEMSGPVRFFAELSDGRALPDGLICTTDGWISGIPAKGTQGSYEVILVAENESGIPLNIQFELTIKERIKLNQASELTQMKAKVWEALEQGFPIPEIAELLSMPLKPEDIRYLVERFAVFTIWDVFNLDPPSEKHVLSIAGLNRHYEIYDCGSCLIGAPKDLFSHERTMQDSYQMARIMAQEAYKRGWTVEFSGIDQVMRAAWVELQHLSELHGKKINIISFNAQPRDIKLLETTAEAWKQAIERTSKPSSS